MWIIILSIFVGCFAAYGLGSLGVCLLDRIYIPPQIVLAVEIKTQADLENLDLILCDACKSRPFGKYKRLTVMLDRSLAFDESKIFTIIEHYNAECLFI